MELSKIKSNITTAFTDVKQRIEKNWANMSTVGKIATVATTALLATAAIAAAVFGHLGFAGFLTLAAGIGLSISLHGAAVAGIVCGAAASTFLTGCTAITAAELLKTPKEKLAKLNSAARTFCSSASSSVSSVLHNRK
jgi:hypothetical protein